jgi:hypothetical protein
MMNIFHRPDTALLLALTI